jgi:hypothetical protein
MLALCFAIDKAHREGHFQNVGVRLNYHLILGPLVLGIPNPSGVYKFTLH